MQWWFERDGQSCGPVSEEELLALISQRSFTATTLVWRDGLSEWTRLRDVPSLAVQLPPEPPPLPPPLPAQASSKPIAMATQSVPPMQVASTGTAPPNEPSRHSHSFASDVTTPATWYRWFARQIDICLLGLPTIFLVFFALSLLLPPALSLKLQDPGVASLAAIAMLCLLGPLAEAAVLSAFGNTPGKLLFGLKVQLLDGRRPSAGEQVRRAYRVMAYGLGFYVPLISLFTCISQFNQIKRNGSAGYDKGLFKVHERKLSGVRKFMAASVCGLLFLAMAGLNAYDKYDTRRIASPKSWTNPATLVATTIPGGWELSSETNSQGQPIHIFTKAADAVQVVFASEDVPRSATLEAYVEAFVRGVKSNMTVSPIGNAANVAGHGARVHTGELLSPQTPIEVTFVKRGDTVWRTVVISHGGEPISPSIDALRTAVFLSVPKQ